MSETCLSNSKLAGVIFGAILGTLLICAVFVVLFWQWFKRHKNDSKIFYVERAAEKEPPKDVEAGSIGRDSVDKNEKSNESIENQPKAEPITQQSIVLNDKRYSTNLLNGSQTSGDSKVLPNLGVTIEKMPRSGFKVTSVEKVESRFVPSDLVTELAVSLDQMTIDDAAKLLELLVPYRIQLEVLRSNSAIEESKYDSTNAEVHKSNEQPAESVESEEVPRLPSVSPPTSPVSNNVESRSPTQLPIPPDTNKDNNKRDSKTSSDDDHQTSKRMATRIPTPKSARSSNRATLEPLSLKESNGTQSENFKSTDFSKRDVLVISNEETDEYGLTNEQYETLENNRRRLERERQSLRDMGILS
ncbi:PDZ domain-containing protein [Aphelenchoides bicaudatus]|nr:PDZ domain-containing protein [Aphelenchoides bicaudatus]